MMLKPLQINIAVTVAGLTDLQSHFDRRFDQLEQIMATGVQELQDSIDSLRASADESQKDVARVVSVVSEKLATLSAQITDLLAQVKAQGDLTPQVEAIKATKAEVDAIDAALEGIAPEGG
jgi:type I site-specific restriction endonuclease